MDGRKLAVGVVAVAILTLGGGVAIAAQPEAEPKIDRAAAEEAALSAVPGEVKDTELESESGSTIYEVEVVGKDGKVREVTVDASSGQVLGQEMEEEEFFEKTGLLLDDPWLRGQMGQTARRFVETLDWQAVADGLATLYDRLLDPGHRTYAAL